MEMGIENWMKAISLLLAVGGIVYTFVRQWTTFQLKIEQIKVSIAEIEKAESANHSTSLNNFAEAITKIEELRKQSRTDLEDLRSETHVDSLILKKEIFSLIKDNKDDNRMDHREIKDAQRIMDGKLTEIIMEIRASRGVRIGNKTKEKTT